jgi:NADP-dependent 3-hydroxy acid dehydrogenase YdfG
METRRIAVVTAADAPLGRAVCLSLVEDGFDVAVLGGTPATLSDLAIALLRNGGRSMAIELDARDPHQVDAAVQEIEAKLGPLDVWLAIDSVADVDAGEPRSTLAPSPIVNGLRAAAQAMAERPGGVLVAITAELGVRADPHMPTASAAAFATRGALQCIRAQLLRQHSRLRLTTVVAPTSMLLPSGRGDGPDEEDCARAAAAVRRALRSARATHTIGWDTWLTFQCARLAPLISERVEADRGTYASRALVRAIAAAAAERARELIHLAPAS